jgi:hypothetical protein
LTSDSKGIKLTQNEITPLMTRIKPLWAFLAQLTALAYLDGPAGGAPVDSFSATHVVSGWLAREPTPLAERLGHQVKGVETVKDGQGTALYHVVRVAPSGFVLVAADDRLEPIVAFGAKGDFAASGRNALRALAGKDLPARLALARAHPGAARFRNARGLWRQFMEGWKSPPTGASPLLLTNVSTVQVAPFLQTLWDQDTVGADTDVACYNYFTPPFAAGNADNYPCGCVATAMAQMMYYFQYPTAGVGTNLFGIVVDGAPACANLRGGDGAGGPYLWSNMPPVPQNPAAAQCQAIGALTYDAGLSVGMAYTADDSETIMFDARQALAGTFLYSNVIIGGEDDPFYSLSSVLINMVNPNLDARLPVMFGIWASPAGGHCVLCDGYGYVGATLYHHLNLGYSGTDDGWYALPDINTDSELTYTNISSCIYNVFATGAGEIISGRIVDGLGNAVPGATVTALCAGGGAYTAASDTNGIYALVQLPPASQYALTASQAGYSNATGQWSTAASQNSTATTGNVWGANFVLTAIGTPSILIGPQSQTLLLGGTASFAVNAAGTGTLAYQWSRNGLSLANSGSSLTISNASAVNAGTYVVVVSNASGTAASAGAVLSLVQAGGAQLVRNGGFETGSFADWQAAGNTADTFVTTGPLYAHAGTYGAALGPFGSLGFLTQNLPTTNGASYLLSCWLDSPDGLTPNEFVVSWNGTNLLDESGLGATGWTNLQFLVVAGAASTPLEFGFRNDNSYFGLDAITVNNLVSVPVTPVSFAGGGIQVNGASIVLTLTNLTGQGTVVVQASADLAQWVPVFTNAPALGGIMFTDVISTNCPGRYYRAVVESSP